jgi:ParB-like chromosome segregation protein Spo0J
VDDEDGVIAGHARLLAAQSVGIVEVPVIVATGWSPPQKRAYLLADNQLALNAGWDRDLLPVELGELAGLSFDTGPLGFDAAFLADIEKVLDGNAADMCFTDSPYNVDYGAPKNGIKHQRA